MTYVGLPRCHSGVKKIKIKNPLANAGDSRDTGSIPGLKRSPSVESGNSLQYSCLENSLDRGARQAAVHGITEMDMIEHTHS